MLHFDNFKFDTQQHILYQNNEVIDLTPNQTKLLTLFLTKPEHIFSKDEILKLVWSDRVVSEQVVFQNISQLRAIFSDVAIKTFPKRGYQWQLSLKDKVLSPVNTHQTTNITNAINFNKTNRIKWLITSAALCIFLICFSLYHFYTSQPIDKKIEENRAISNITMLPFSTRFDGQLNQVISQHNHTFSNVLKIPIKTIDASNTDAWNFFNSPYMMRKKLITNNNQLIISGFINQAKSRNSSQPPHYIMEYLIQGEYRSWQGYLVATSTNSLTDKLIKQTQLIANSKFFTPSTDAFTTPELSTLHNEHPNNLDILKHLTLRLLYESNYDEASARIEQMLKLSGAQQHSIYTAYATWLKGKVLFHHKQYEMAQNTLEKARNLMTGTGLLSLQSEISKTLADIPSINKDFKKIQDYLYQAASQARLANRPVQEIRAYTLLSIEAATLGLDKEKYIYLEQAKTLLSDYKLDGSHYMLIYLHFALFATSEEEKQKYYLKVLEQPVTPKNMWVFFKVSKQLTSIYIKQNKFEHAIKLAENVTLPARAAALYAEIYSAQGKLVQAHEQAQTAFNFARTQGMDWLGLDMALMLLEINPEQSDSTNILIYKRYIESTATPGWKKYQNNRLSKVGISMI